MTILKLKFLNTVISIQNNLEMNKLCYYHVDTSCRQLKLKFLKGHSDLDSILWSGSLSGTLFRRVSGSLQTKGYTNSATYPKLIYPHVHTWANVPVNQSSLRFDSPLILSPMARLKFSMRTSVFLISVENTSLPTIGQKGTYQVLQ